MSALSVTFGDSSPKVGAKNVEVKSLPLTLGEVDLRSKDGEGEVVSDFATAPVCEAD